MKYVWIYLALITVFTFALAGIDKYRAQHGGWRIPESTLFLSAALGGSIGLLVGMRVFRHKTRHASFVIGVPLILLLQVAAACGVYYLIYIR